MMAVVQLRTPTTEGRTYYEPGEEGLEKRIKERLDYWRRLRDQSPGA